MSSEPVSRGLSDVSSSPSLPEQFGSFADYAASTIATPRPAATTLDVARYHAFTGEISFATDPAVRFYLDGGTVYHAERFGDPAIGQTLRELGVLDAEQLERGMVRVGDVEHLGRLFDREPSIDRDAAIVAMEMRTEAIVRELANHATCSVAVSAYRHHPSGIHRWFVASTEEGHSERPISAVAQVDRSVVDELPALPGGPPTLEIKWSDPDPSGALPALEFAPAADDEIDDGDSALPIDAAAAPQPLSEFHVVWPDGTADAPIASGEPANVSSPLPPPPTPSPDAPPPDAPSADAPPADAPPAEAPPVDASPAEAPPAEAMNADAPAADAPAADAPVADAPTPNSPELSDAPDPLTGPPDPDHTIDSTTDAPPSFSIAPLQIDSLPEPDAAIPDDVAAAVKRALKAIEGASTGGAVAPELAVSPITLSELGASAANESAPAIVDAEAASADAAPSDPVPDQITQVEEPVAPSSLPAPQQAPASPGFAPPTLDMRAEAVYARAAAARDEERRSAADAVESDAEDAPGHVGQGRASVVFVDDEAAPQPAAERRSALRRLIGSLRHKDD